MTFFFKLAARAVSVQGDDVEIIFISSQISVPNFCPKFLSKCRTRSTGRRYESLREINLTFSMPPKRRERREMKPRVGEHIY